MWVCYLFPIFIISNKKGLSINNAFLVDKNKFLWYSVLHKGVKKKMTEEEFKKAMSKVIGFIVVALIILVIIGVIVFNTAGKQTSIFGSKQEAESYKKRVQEENSYNLTEEEVEESAKETKTRGKKKSEEDK